MRDRGKVTGPSRASVANPKLTKREEQVAAQYRVVAHMAEALADIHIQTIPLIEGGSLGVSLNIQAERSAKLIEVLGNILNSMDAIIPEQDAWMYPIIESSREFLLND